MALCCMSFLFRVLSKISIGNAPKRQDIRRPRPDKPYLITHNKLLDRNVTKYRVVVLRQPPKGKVQDVSNIL